MWGYILGGLSTAGITWAYWKFVKRCSRFHTLKSALNQFIILNVMYWLGKSCRKTFDKDTSNMRNVQEEFLLSILKDSKDTEFGKRFNFTDIKSREEYAERVPLSYYDLFKPYIDRIEELGEQNLLSSYELVQLAITSGTSGSKKLLPFTKKHKGTFFFRGITVVYNTLLSIPGIFDLQKTCKLMHLPKKRVSKSGLKIGPNSSSPEDSKTLLDLYSTPVAGYLQVTTERECLYIHLLFALKDEFLGQIEANFVSIVYQAFVFLQNNWKDLCDDIRRGEITHIQLEPDTLKVLNKALKGPDPKRADDLEKEFNIGLDNIATRIWPNMRCLLTCNTGCSFELYAQNLQRYVDPQAIPTYSPLYAASEGLIAININIRKGEYIFVPRAIFFEFIPIEYRAEENPPVLFIDQLEVDKCYELVITNLSGLYRFRMGDVIKIVGYYNKCPVMEFQYRTGQILNVKGEKTSEQQLYDAIKQTNWGDKIVEFTSVDYLQEKGLSETPYYSIYIELENEITLTKELKLALDEALCVTNPIYETFRVKGSILEPSLSLLKRGTFQKMKELLVEEGTGVNQVKIPRVLRKQAHIDLFRENIVQVV